MRIGIYCSSLENLTKHQKEMVDILISEGHTVERLGDMKINGKEYDQVWIDECSEDALNVEEEFYLVMKKYVQNGHERILYYTGVDSSKSKKVSQPYFRQNQRW